MTYAIFFDATAGNRRERASFLHTVTHIREAGKKETGKKETGKRDREKRERERELIHILGVRYNRGEGTKFH